MLDILSRVKSIIEPTILRTALSSGECSTCSPFTSVSKLINPLTPFLGIIDPREGSGAKGTNTWHDLCPTGFKSLFFRGDVPQGGMRPPTNDEWDQIDSWLTALNQLLDRFPVLTCMLNMLCDCKPKITVYIRTKGFAVTTYASGSNGEFTMGFNIKNMGDEKFLLSNHYMTQAYYYELNSTSIDLRSSVSSIGYFGSNTDPHHYAGFVVHELGHVLDKLYASYYYPRDYTNSQVHAFMWQSFYYMSFYLHPLNTGPTPKVPRFKSNWDFLNLTPERDNCEGIQAQLNAYPPDLTIAKVHDEDH